MLRWISFVPAATSTYYLVVPQEDGSTEGTYGVDSEGDGRPTGGNQCESQVGATCPP